MLHIFPSCHKCVVIFAIYFAASQLSEAAQLWSQFEETSEFLSGWVDRTDPVVKSELVISDPEQIANQIDQHQVGCVRILGDFTQVILRYTELAHQFLAIIFLELFYSATMLGGMLIYVGPFGLPSFCLASPIA